MDRVKQYIDKGENPNCRDDEERTLLHNACLSGNCELVRYLCEVVNNSTSSKDKFGNTSLHLACMFGSYQIVRYLIDDKNCETNTKSKQGHVPLYVACVQGHLNVVKYMISTGHCDIRVSGLDGENLLHAACCSENLELVQYLVKMEGFDIHQKTKDGKRRTALHYASLFSSKPVVQWLVEQGLDPEERAELGATPIHVVSDVNAMRFFLEPEPSGLNCNPNICSPDGFTPLHCAVLRNQQEIVKYLVCEKKCDPMQCDNYGHTCPHFAASEGALTVLKFLVESGCDMNRRNKEGDTALLLACKHDHPDVVKYMISTGRCDIKVRGFTGVNLLHAACRSQYLELVQYLVNVEGFDINQKTKNMRSPQDLLNEGLVDSIPVLLGSPEIVEYCTASNPLDLTCNPNTCSESGQTPLHFAVGYCKQETAKCLICERKRDIMQRDYSSNICPHSAAEEGDFMVVKFLVKSGCKLNIMNSSGYTALSLACKNGRHDVVKYMISTGRCDKKIRGFAGENLLHAACRSQNLELIQHLVKLEGFDIHHKTNDKKRRTALHLASQFSSIAVVKWLVEQGLDPEERDECGVTPIHVVSNMNVLRYFLEPKPSGLNCNPNICSASGQTPLHFAVSHNRQEIVRYLVCVKDCDPMQCDNHGYMCPHFAFNHNGAMYFLELFFKVGCDLSKKNKDGLSPLHLALEKNASLCIKFLLDTAKCKLEISEETVSALHVHKLNYDCIKCVLHSTSVKSIEKRNLLKVLKRTSSYFSQNVDQTVKIAVVGDSQAGKSTLVRCMKEETKRSFSHLFRSESGKSVSSVEEHTAGIITYVFESKHFGHVLIFDFAGHEEYHASHSEVMAKFLLQDTIVFLVVDVSLSDKEVELSVKRWLSFVNILCSQAGTQSNVLVIASHIDRLKYRILRLDKMKFIMTVIEKITPVYEHVRITRIVDLDCRELVSTGLDLIRNELTILCSKLRAQVDIDIRCLEIMEHISSKYSKRLSCTVGDLFKSLQWKELECKDIIPFLKSLHEKGFLILTESKCSSVEDCMFIFNYADLLETVNGSIFAPKEFHKIFKDLCTNTGIVTYNKVRKAFPTIADTNVIIVYLEHLQFCRELTLSILFHLDMVPEGYSAEERFFFFPSLVARVRDDSFFQQIAGEKESNKREIVFWLLTVRTDGEFPANFLHHIILCLVLNYLQDPSDADDKAPVILKLCKLWNAGICWSGCGSHHVLVEQVEKKALVVLVSCTEERKVEMMRLLSRLVHDILMIKDETCGNIPVCESLVPKELIHSYQPTLRHVQSLESYSMQDIWNCIKQSGSHVVNLKMQSRQVADLVTAEPFCMLSSWQPETPNVLSTMLDNLDVNVPTSHIKEPANSFSELTDPKFLQGFLGVRMNADWITLPPSVQFQKVLVTWINQRGKRATYRELFKELSVYSIFCGRNPRVSSESVHS